MILVWIIQVAIIDSLTMNNILRENVFPAIILAFVCAGCSEGSSSVMEETIPLFDYSQEVLSDLEPFTDSTIVVELKSEGDEVFGVPEKCVFKDNKIIVLERVGYTEQKLRVFDAKGNYLCQVGGTGRGPGEYLDISDFAVSPDGFIWIEDAQANRVLKYGPDYRYVESMPMPVDVECFVFLDDNTLLAGIAPWESDGHQIVVTDTQFVAKSVELNFSEYNDPNFMFSEPNFMKDKTRYFYSRPIDDNIYLCDASGTLVKRYYLDFGKATVPLEDRVDAGNKIEYNYFKDYTLLLSFGVVGERYVIGRMYDKGYTRQFIADRENEIIYKSEAGSVDGSFIGYSDGYLISVIEPEEDSGCYKLEFRRIRI